MTYNQAHDMNRASAKLREKRHALKIIQAAFGLAQQALFEARAAEQQATEDFYAKCDASLNPLKQS